MYLHEISIRPAYEPLLRHNRFIPSPAFERTNLVVWRKLNDRENGTMELVRPDGRKIKLHVKRFLPGHGKSAKAEGAGIEYLEKAEIPTVPLVLWVRFNNGTGAVITEDLAEYEPGDKFIEAGMPFEKLLKATADLTAKLHRAGLHHRDLYLCHFLVKDDDIRLIDAARVKPLPGWPTRRRWIVKDLAQFWYSTTKLPITDEQRMRWLKRYAQHVKTGSIESLRKAIEAKVRRIAAHDAKLNRRQPTRHISIPDGNRR
jgi:hypothetical protein